jgi:hypothetical protein
MRERKLVRGLQNLAVFLVENRLAASLSSIGLKVYIRPGHSRKREVRSAEKSRKIWVSPDLDLEEASISGFPSSSQEISTGPYDPITPPRIGVMHPDWFFRTSHSGWRFVSISEQEIRGSLISKLVDATTYSFVRGELSRFLNAPDFQLLSGRGKFREKLVPGMSCETLPAGVRTRSLLSVASQLRKHYRDNPKIFSCDFQSNGEIASELKDSGALKPSDPATNFLTDFGEFIPLIVSHGDIAIQNMVLNNSDVPIAEEAQVLQENHELLKARIFMVDFENCGFRPFWADSSALVLQLVQHGYCEDSASKLFSELLAPFGYTPVSNFSKNCRRNLETLKVIGESKIFQLHEVTRERVFPVA